MRWLYQDVLRGGDRRRRIVWGARLERVRDRLRSPKRADAIDDRIPKQTHGQTALEITWTAIPLVTVLVLFWLTFNTINSSPGERAAEPGVSRPSPAFRWQWRSTTRRPRSSRHRHAADTEARGPGRRAGPRDDVTSRRQRTRSTCRRSCSSATRSPVDNRFDFRVEVRGHTRGECAEFCGVFHTQMQFTVRAVPRPNSRHGSRSNGDRSADRAPRAVDAIAQRPRATSLNRSTAFPRPSPRRSAIPRSRAGGDALTG